MKQDIQSALPPKLRFPEFVGQSYRDVRLQDVTAECATRNGNTLSPKSVMGVTKSEGIVPMRERLIGADISRYKLVRKNWFAYNPMRLNIGSIGWWTNDRDILVSPDYVVFRCLEESASVIDPAYLDHFRRSEQWEDFVTESGIGSVRVRIYYNDISRLELKLPSVAEQQKIANCLTALDEVIAAQSQKCEALKTHKKGLMQRLFPREGETEPRLRFPEFRDAGEWQEIELGEKVDLLSGYPFDGADISQDSKGIRLLRGINVTEGRVRNNPEIDRYYTGLTDGLKKFQLQTNDLVIGMDGSKVGKNSALVSESNSGELLIQRVARLRAKNPALIQFIFQRINSPAFYSYVDRINTSSGIPHISAKQIKEFKISFPSDAEQRRIAECLTTLDDLIAAQTQKLEALKTYKKGLMQQLFPYPEEAKA